MIKGKLLALLTLLSLVAQSQIHYVNTAFENASQVDWSIDSNNVVQIGLIYDHERSSINRANGHWHFQLQGVPGTEVILIAVVLTR